MTLMGGVVPDLEDLAEAMRKLAGHGPDDYAVATDVAIGLVGEAGIIVDPTLAGSTYFREHDGGYEIVLRLDAPDVRHRLLHESGHVALRKLAGVRLPRDEEERAANYLAAAVMAPRELLRRAHAHYGEDHAALAKTFGMSQTSIVLRLAEVGLGDERAVVTKTGNVLLRTRGAINWANIPVVDVAAGRQRWKGLVKARLRGGIDEGRVALRCELFGRR